MKKESLFNILYFLSTVAFMFWAFFGMAFLSLYIGPGALYTEKDFIYCIPQIMLASLTYFLIFFTLYATQEIANLIRQDIEITPDRKMKIKYGSFGILFISWITVGLLCNVFVSIAIFIQNIPVQVSINIIIYLATAIILYMLKSISAKRLTK